MAHRFNPPPGWPTPPAGWTPPPGWQPDPSWPPPPVGWQLWVYEPDAYTRPLDFQSQVSLILAKCKSFWNPLDKRWKILIVVGVVLFGLVFIGAVSNTINSSNYDAHVTSCFVGQDGSPIATYSLTNKIGRASCRERV